MTPDLDRLEGLVESVGQLPICPGWTYEAIRHGQRNCGFDTRAGFNEPDRYAGQPMAEIVNALPYLISEIRRMRATGGKILAKFDAFKNSSDGSQFDGYNCLADGYHWNDWEDFRQALTGGTD